MDGRSLVDRRHGDLSPWKPAAHRVQPAVDSTARTRRPANLRAGTPRRDLTLSGAVGFLLSAANGNALTVGASGSIFGLLGAIVAYGLRRGGVFGRMMFQQYGVWALVLFLSAYFISHVDN